MTDCNDFQFVDVKCQLAEFDQENDALHQSNSDEINTSDQTKLQECIKQSEARVIECISSKFKSLSIFLSAPTAKIELPESTTTESHSSLQLPIQINNRRRRLFDIIDNQDDIDNFEARITDDIEYNNIVQSVKEKFGENKYKDSRTVAFTLVDYFWTRKFFVNASWSGRTYNKVIIDRIKMQAYEKTLDLFRHCVSCCSPNGWTDQENENFIKDMLSNGKSRFTRQGIRTVVSRNRPLKKHRIKKEKNNF